MATEEVGEAGEAINSLLTEIDNEMSFITEDEAGKASWKIPLQEIGDETMEMIISHNTMNNTRTQTQLARHRASCGETGGEQIIKAESPAKKYVAFSEGISVHELPLRNNADADNEDAINTSDSVNSEAHEPDTQWKQSKFARNCTANEANDHHLLMGHSESESEQSDSDAHFTKEEFQQHTVTETEEKLSHILDSKANIHKLKQMADEISTRANDIREEPESKTLMFALQPTKPLISDIPPSSEETRLIHFEAADSGEDDNNSYLDEADEDYVNEIVHSPSKIPLTNKVNINSFRLDETQNESQTRVSSGSSWGESVTDLATIRHDRYNLLEYSSNIPKELQSENEPQKESLENMSTNYRNISQVFSIATTTDGYKSAKEAPSEVKSVASNAEYLPNISSSFGSVEDLSISKSLTRDEETLKNIHRQMEGLDGIHAEMETSEAINASYENNRAPQLPHLPVVQNAFGYTANNKALDNNMSLQEATDDDLSLHDDEKPDLEFTGLHDIPDELPEKHSTVRDNSFTEKTDDLTDIKSETGQALCQTESLLSSAPAIGQNNNPADLSESGLGRKETSNEYPRDAEKKENAKSCPTSYPEPANNLAQILPPVQRIGSIFMDDPFGDEFDTSGESLDLTKSVKPSNYLSIWHMQEEDIKSSSPAISSESQFSHYSATTGTSIESSVRASAVFHDPKSNIGTFKFKPRVISRSKYYYPDNKSDTSDHENDYVIANFEKALDPLRRNTIISRKIQENIRSRKFMHPRTDYPVEKAQQKISEIIEEQDANKLKPEADVAQIGPDEEASLHNSIEESYEKEKALSSTSEELDLLPCVVDSELGKDLISFLDMFDNDNKSTLSLRGGKEGALNIWDDDHEHGWDKESVRKKRASFEAINRLLADENNEPEALKESQDPVTPKKSNAVLKTPNKEVSIGHGLSVNGYEADVTHDNDSDQNSARCESFVQSSENETPLESPMKATHVGSPFKILKARKLDPPTEDEGNWSAIEPVEKNIVENKTETPSKTTEQDIFHAGPQECAVDFPDKGTIYIKLNTIANLSLHGLKHHNAEFSVEVDNGENVVKTPWKIASSEKSIDIQKEFEIILSSTAESSNILIITLKCRYKRPQSELAEVVEKVPISKKFRFGKSKFEYKKKFVQRGIKYDEWDYLFAQDGSFGRCEIKLDLDFLKEVKFHSKALSLDLKNEWARKPDFNNLSKPICELPRRAPSFAATLQIGMCYLERSSPLEKFPKTLHIAQSIMKKYKILQTIAKEGFLFQEGGDVHCRLQRRFFKLQGSTMVGYHEISREPKIDINLLKVVKVFGPGDVPKEGERNLTDFVLFGGCIHLIFDNDEEISFNSDTKEEIESWYQALRDVVDMNKCHQPWVKQLHEHSLISSL